MRIIAGEARGRRIVAPGGLSTRPPLDRIRESVFAILGERVEGADVLDLFAGSGAFGLEAVSRGALQATFVDRDPAALSALERNVRELGFTGRAWIVRGDALACPPAGRAERAGGGASAPRRGAADRRGDAGPAAGEPFPAGGFGLVFLDPPFEMVERDPAAVLARVEGLVARHLRPGGVLLLRHPSSVPLAREGASSREFGESAVLFIEKG